MFVEPADVERADRAMEARELAGNPDAELDELTGIHMERGVNANLAREVATALHVKDPLQVHLRHEVGHNASSTARPVQASVASAISRRRPGRGGRRSRRAASAMRVLIGGGLAMAVTAAVGQLAHVSGL